MNLSPYNILDITPGADWEKIKKAYKKQALKWHPDKQTPQGFTKEQQTEKFKEISNAFEQLYKEKLGSDEEEADLSQTNPQDIIDEIFAEAGFENFESWEKYFLDFSKKISIENIKSQMIGIENEIDNDPNFWNRFGKNWEEKIRQMHENSKVISFQDKMLEALKKISEEKFANERAKTEEFIENSDKGLKFIKKHLKHKNLSNADFNDYIKKSSPALMTVGNNWYEEHINWGHESSINTYISLIDNCANEKQVLLDKQRANWKKSRGGDSYSRALSIAEINDYWGSETIINGKKLEEVIGSDWKSHINNSKGLNIKEKTNYFKKMINQAKNTNQNSLPYVLGGIGIFALLSLIIVLATNRRRE